METDKTELEKKFLYRAVKVSYIFFFVVISLVILVSGWNQRPTSQVNVDYTKSYLVCNNGKNYTLISANINLIGTGMIFGSDENKVRTLCEYNVLVEDYQQQSMDLYGNTGDKYKVPANKNYLLNVINSTSNSGSWNAVLDDWAIGIGILYVVLNLMKETSFYVLFGKKFSWDWLVKGLFKGQENT